MDSTGWLQAQSSASSEPGLWLASSLLLAAIAANLAWLAQEGPLGGRVVEQLLDWPGTPAVVWSLTSLFLFLVPALAWRFGAVSPYFLGIGELDWVPALGAGGLLGVVAVAAVVTGWGAYRHSVGAYGPAARSRWLAPLQAIVWQWHWAFYRAVAVSWLAARALDPAAGPSSGVLAALLDQPFYWGSWLGLALTGLEAALNPYLWANLRLRGRLEGTARTVALGFITTALFTLTRNLWLCMACHVLVEVVVAGWLPIPAAAEQTEVGRRVGIPAGRHLFAAPARAPQAEPPSLAGANALDLASERPPGWSLQAPDPAHEDWDAGFSGSAAPG